MKLFDPFAALAAIEAELAAKPANPANRPATVAPGEASFSGLAGLAEDPVASEALSSPPLRDDDDPYRYGRGIHGEPKTWTGKIVSLDEWRKLSQWERHGSTGLVWNGLSREWESRGG